MRRLELDKRLALSRLIYEARAARGWNQEEAAEAATECLRVAAREDEDASTEEREMWQTIEITRHAVSTLENFPSNPIISLARRSCLLGLTLALGLDRAVVNRLCGGV